MISNWLKHYMPRSLYGRSAMIIIMPIVVLQIVASVAFIQRHLEDVTQQMTITIARELRMIAHAVDTAQSEEDALQSLGSDLRFLRMNVRFLPPEDVPDADSFTSFDYSGRLVAKTLRSSFTDLISVTFTEDKRVFVVLTTDHGPMEIEFDRRRVTVTAPHQLLVTMFFFAIVMSVIASLYMRNQLRPIKRLARVAQQFGRGRIEPFKPAGATEVRAAGGAFLDMRARIERQIEQRTMMLSGVSHDLRSPLTRLRLGLELIDEEDAKPMLGDVQEMQHLIDAFLEFSKDASEAQMELTDPCALVRDIVADSTREGRDVTLGVLEPLGEIKLRPTAMRRAVENLIGNAVRYGTKARVSCVLSEKSLRIRVEDDGPGIPADQRGVAIKPFTRLDPARNQNKGTGVGLGLAIVADIARAHGGTLRLGESRELGGLQADIVIAR